VALLSFKKGPQDVKLEIQAFRIHLESLHAHEDVKLRVDADRQAVSHRRKEFVARKMVEHDSKATMVLERKTWGWSLLYHAFTMAKGGLPAHIKRPFLHTDDELTDLVTWIADDILPRLEVASVPPPVLAMKFLSRMWTWPAIPFSCPMQRGILQDVKEDVDCLRISLQEVVRLGSIHFPGLSFSEAELLGFADALDQEGPFPEAAESTLVDALTWLHMLFFKACHDMVVSGKRNHLSVLWTSGPGVSQNEVARQLWEVLLVRENVDLRWLWGAVDCTCKLDDEVRDLLPNLAIFQETSIARCTKLLEPWKAGEEPGGSGLASLAELTLPS
jgi:hypothetical protein